MGHSEEFDQEYLLFRSFNLKSRNESFFELILSIRFKYIRYLSGLDYYLTMEVRGLVISSLSLYLFSLSYSNYAGSYYIIIEFYGNLPPISIQY